MRYVIAFLVAVALLVIAQNTGVVTLRFLVWKGEMSLVLVLLFTTVLGFVAGYLLGRLGGSGGRDPGPGSGP